MAVSIWWIRKDLRLGDNRALSAALETGLPLVPLFIQDAALFSDCPKNRKNFLLDGLRALDQELQKLGGSLVVRAGKPLEVLEEILLAAGGGQIFAEEDFTHYARKRDQEVSAKLPATFVKGNLRVPPGILMSKNGRPFQVFTAFARAWKALPVLAESVRPLPDRLPIAPMPGLPVIDSKGNAIFPAGEQEAQNRLKVFLAGGIHSYHETRDYPALDGTSRLSPYFRFGMLSAEYACRAAFEAQESAPEWESHLGPSTWLNELIWREFYIQILFHHPEVRQEAFRPELRSIRWRKAPGELDAWKYGQTGCPVVDAGMRQLLQTGWMHNRVRMIAASYLVKDLLIDWREGERWFAENLIDYDPAANNGGWQWTAGTGTDAAPYFRIFNPSLQGRRFDPDGEYVRRWVPELATMPARFIQEPWKAPVHSRPAAYPAPLVEHSSARIRTLAAYRKAGEEKTEKMQSRERNSLQV